MSELYITDEKDVERCRAAKNEAEPIELTGTTAKSGILHAYGIVQSVEPVKLDAGRFLVKIADKARAKT